MTTSPADLANQRPLAEAIAAVTRSVHFKLNKLIIAKLPYALPPRASDPASYVAGLLHIAPIYITFESLWQSILDAPPLDSSGTDATSHSRTDISQQAHHGESLADKHHHDHHDRVRIHRPAVREHIHSRLQQLHLPGLVRSRRIRSDIRAMTGWSEHVVEEQLQAVSQTGRLGEFVGHIKQSIGKKPHVLLAYSYIMFMALFAGGRFIRASLEAAGGSFWEQVPSPIKPFSRLCEEHGMCAPELDEEAMVGQGRPCHKSHGMPLRFFHFATPMDGEDLKREFKKRLSEAETTLTPQEKQDIVQEAVCIFDNMLLLVKQLEETCEDPNEEDSDTEGQSDALSSLLKNPFGNRFRDSVAIAKERRARSSSRRSSSEEKSTCSFLNGRQDTETNPSSIKGAATVHLNMAHPPVPGMANIELCPGFAKSMRFDKLATPARRPQAAQGAAIDISDNFKMASKRIYGIHITEWVMMAAFGAIIFGLVMTSRRGMMEV